MNFSEFVDNCTDKEFESLVNAVALRRKRNEQARHIKDETKHPQEQTQNSKSIVDNYRNNI